jgi:hypothetical protein
MVPPLIIFGLVHSAIFQIGINIKLVEHIREIKFHKTIEVTSIAFYVKDFFLEVIKTL